MLRVATRTASSENPRRDAVLVRAVGLGARRAPGPHPPTDRRGLRYLVCARGAVDAELRHARFERRGRQPQERCCTALAPDPPSDAIEDARDVAALDGLEREARVLGGGGAAVGRVDAQTPATAQDEGPLHDVPQLADVPRPRVPPESLETLLGQLVDLLPHVARELIDDRLDQDGNVL